METAPKSFRAQFGKEKSRFWFFPFKVVSSRKVWFDDGVLAFDRPTESIYFHPNESEEKIHVADLKGGWQGNAANLFHGEIVAPKFTITINKRTKLGFGNRHCSLQVAESGATFPFKFGGMYTKLSFDGFGSFEFHLQGPNKDEVTGQFSVDPPYLGEVLAALLLLNNFLRDAAG